MPIRLVDPPIFGQLWDTRAGVISTQVLQELAVNLRRQAKRPLSSRAVRDLIADYRAWTIVVNGLDAILEALDLESQYRISFRDALVIQAAQASAPPYFTPKTSPTGGATAPSGCVTPCAAEPRRPYQRPRHRHVMGREGQNGISLRDVMG